MVIKDNRVKGVICIIASAFCFALMNAFVRMAGELPTMQKSFFRNVVALAAATVVLLRSEEKFRFKKSNLPYFLMRAGFGTVGILCNFYAIDHLVLSDASMLNKLSPFFAVICSYFILKERVTLFQGLSVAAAFVGGLFIIKPAWSGMNIAGLIGMLGGLGAGAAYTMVRKLSQRGERGPFIVFFFSAFSTLITLPLMLADYAPMTAVQLIILILAGISAAGGQFTITAAYSFAPAREISVFDYTQIIFAALLGFLLFDQIPDVLSVIGYIVICSVGIAMFLYNSKRFKEQS